MLSSEGSIQSLLDVSKHLGYKCLSSPSNKQNLKDKVTLVLKDMLIKQLKLGILITS